MEVHCLVDEVRKYCTLIKLLQKSLQDTRKTFHDINEAKCVIESELTYFNVFRGTSSLWCAIDFVRYVVKTLPL